MISVMIRERDMVESAGYQSHSRISNTVQTELSLLRKKFFGHTTLGYSLTVSPAEKSNVRAAAFPVNTVARAWPLWK